MNPPPDDAPTATPPAVELSGIWKRFPGVVANAGANLTVRTGTVHAVLGENGAGKSTLMNVLSGVYRPDEGEVRIDGVVHHFRSPSDALAAGVGMVHQEFRLVPSFTVAENVVLGAAERIVRRQAVESAVGELAERFGQETPGFGAGRVISPPTLTGPSPGPVKPNRRTHITHFHLNASGN